MDAYDQMTQYVKRGRYTRNAAKVATVQLSVERLLRITLRFQGNEGPYILSMTATTEM